MHIVKAKVRNYKCFVDTGIIKLSPHFNVVIGANDGGKTALLEGLSTQFPAKPHRSLASSPRASVRPPPYSTAELEFFLSRQEFDDMFSTAGDRISFPVSEAGRDYSATMNEEYFNRIQSCTSVILEIRDGAPFSIQFGGYERWIINTDYLQAQIHKSGGKWVAQGPAPGLQASLNGSWILNFANALARRIYAFKAERLNIAESNMGGSPELEPNASNLAQVILRQLSNNPERHRRFVEYVRTVFPHILNVTCPSLDGNRTRVLLWTVDPKTEREDLAISLQDSGTGIGQVLAVLYVVVNSPEGRTIIIDEPQSFLHPGAVSKLIQIMRQHQQHQFIISTHSTNAVFAAEPLSVFSARRSGSHSTITEVNIKGADEALALLADVGARLSDVFGADQILWVEGPTEERCFPMIMEALLPKKFFGVKVLGVLHTSEFSKSEISRTVEIYRRLSGGALLIPPSLHFVLDSEGLDSQSKKNLQDRSGRSLSFLSRRMYENYLLFPQAIASLLVELDSSGPTHSTEDVIEWINSHKWNKQYFDRREIAEGLRNDAFWLKNVHAGQLLDDLFNDITEARVSYKNQKVLLGTALTKILISSKPDAFEEIVALLNGIAPASEQSPTET